MPKTVPKEQLLEMAGHQGEPSSWIEIDQERIDRFAEVTDDRQFIHVDPVRAAETPLGGTIAHGFLILSLLPVLFDEVGTVPEGAVMTFNYGLNRVRFVQPVRAGSRVRLLPKIAEVREVNGGRLLVTARATLEIEGEEKPALVAETLTLFVVR